MVYLLKMVMFHSYVSGSRWYPGGIHRSLDFMAPKHHPLRGPEGPGLGLVLNGLRSGLDLLLRRTTKKNMGV
jgi:hypothetical protein